MTILDYIIQSLRDTATKYNENSEVKPACILWTDGTEQWRPIIERLQSQMPELFVLGEYNPEKRIGPGIWLRCVLANQIQGIQIPENLTPIFYLPNVSRRDDLRAVDECPEHLKPLAELQFRGIYWTQRSCRDWTPFAMTISNWGGIELKCDNDDKTNKAMLRALNQFVVQDIDSLKDRTLNYAYFDSLLVHDPIRNLLQWINSPEDFKNGITEQEWSAFVEVSISQFQFNPEDKNEIEAARLLANHTDCWQDVWNRFCESPRTYSNIPNQIRKNAISNNIFGDVSEGPSDGWPQWNEEQENNLRDELKKLKDLPTHQARTKILELNHRHHKRLKSVWNTLGETPFANAVNELATLVTHSENALASGSLDDLAHGYQTEGWQVDNAARNAFAAVKSKADCDVVTIALQSVYVPWLETSARYFQQLISETPNTSFANIDISGRSNTTAVLFVDGLRYDLAQNLISKLETKPNQNTKFDITQRPYWTPLPSITATGKYAVSPIAGKMIGNVENSTFNPIWQDTNKAVADTRFQKLVSESQSAGLTPRWEEFGNIDKQGHELGSNLINNIPTFLDEIVEKIEALTKEGIKTIHVVTDHGWLLVPGGLPKSELHSDLTLTKWGRCAAIKPGATVSEKLYCWYWNPVVSFALANGVSCYKMGTEYTHGGASLQECHAVQITINVTQSNSLQNTQIAESLEIRWRGLRCEIQCMADPSYTVDLRIRAKDKNSSIAQSVKPIKPDGSATLFVEDEDFEGTSAFLVILDSQENVIAQQITIISGE